MPVKMSTAEAKKRGLHVPRTSRKAAGAKGGQGSVKANRYAAFASLCEEKCIPKPMAEFQFCEGRKWRFDWCWFWYGKKIALECDGGVWIHGRHTRGSGFLKDAEKFNEAACLGWLILRCQPSDLQDCRGNPRLSEKLLRLLRRALQ